MARTTIELSEEQKQMLKDERMPHETNYGETIERLCGQSNLSFVTESEVQEIVSEMVVLEALE